MIDKHFLNEAMIASHFFNRIVKLTFFSLDVTIGINLLI